MSIHLLPYHPFLKRDSGFTPQEICYDMFTLYYHNFFDVLDRLKAALSEETSTIALLTRAAINFAYNQVAPWVNLNAKPTDKKSIADRYPVTLDNVVWLLLSTEITLTFPKEFGFKTILPLLLHTNTPAYELDSVNRALADYAAASTIDESTLALIPALFAEFPDRVAEYKGGKTNMVNFFIGETIKRSKNKSPELRAKVAELLEIL